MGFLPKASYLAGGVITGVIMLLLSCSCIRPFTLSSFSMSHAVNAAVISQKHAAGAITRVVHIRCEVEGCSHVPGS